MLLNAMLHSVVEQNPQETVAEFARQIVPKIIKHWILSLEREEYQFLQSLLK
jgi:hypothetical protein